MIYASTSTFSVPSAMMWIIWAVSTVFLFLSWVKVHILGRGAVEKADFQQNPEHDLEDNPECVLQEMSVNC